MGLLSKKTVVCERCGKEYEVRIAFGAHICDDCKLEEGRKMVDIIGYLSFAKAMGLHTASIHQYEDIVRHRSEILEKYRMTEGISREELMYAGDNYRKLTEEQAQDVIVRFANSTIETSAGAAYTENFFAPMGFPRTIVDADDVFAVGYTTDRRILIKGQEAILCAVFTNDPFLPFFPMIYAGKLGFFDVVKSKKGREGVSELFEGICKNLTYPVQDIMKLAKTVSTEGSVRGDMDGSLMLQGCSLAVAGKGIFDSDTISGEIPMETADLLDEYGYVDTDTIAILLKLDKTFPRMYWEKQAKKMGIK